jgi:hypothetical protein
MRFHFGSPRVLYVGFMLALLLSLQACRRPSSIDGQVFITTKGGENVKLAAVQVALLESKAVEKLLPTLQANWLKAMDQAIADIVNGMSSSSRTDETDRKAYENLALAGSGQDTVVAKLPQALRTATSDADGRFSFAGVDAGSGLALSACSKRHLPFMGQPTIGRSGAEYYCWLVPVPPPTSGDRISVMLTGSNQIGEGGQGISLVYRPKK